MMMTRVRMVSFYLVLVVVVVVVGGAEDYQVDDKINIVPSEILTVECCRNTSNELVAMVLRSSADGEKILAHMSSRKPHFERTESQFAAFGHMSSDQNPSMMVVALEPSLSSDIHENELFCVYHVDSRKETKPAVVRRRPAKRVELKTPKPQAEAKTNFTLLIDLLDEQTRWNRVLGEREGPAGNENSVMVYDPEEGLLTKVVNTPADVKATLLISNDSQFYEHFIWRCQMKGEQFSARTFKKKQTYRPCTPQNDQACEPKNNTTCLIIIGLLVLVVISLLVCVFCIICRKRKKKPSGQSSIKDDDEGRIPIKVQDTSLDYNASY